jgi:hypothetical protein
MTESLWDHLATIAKSHDEDSGKGGDRTVGGGGKDPGRKVIIVLPDAAIAGVQSFMN